MMSDDLKDGCMAIDYAFLIRDENVQDKPIADMMAKYASERMAHFSELHKIFVEESKKEEPVKGRMEDCLWDEIHQEMQEKYYTLEQKVKKY